MSRLAKWAIALNGAEQNIGIDRMRDSLDITNDLDMSARAEKVQSRRVKSGKIKNGCKSLAGNRLVYFVALVETSENV